MDRCRNGLHDLSLDNLYSRSDGARRCRACTLSYQKRRREDGLIKKAPSRARHGMRLYNKGCRCEACCAAKAHSDDLRRASNDRYNETRRRKRGNPRQPRTLMDYTCENEECRKIFHKKQNGRPYRFCSLKCAGNAHGRRPAHPFKSRQKTIRTWTCTRCGDVFEREGNHRYRFCSRECADSDRTERDHPNLRPGQLGQGTLTNCGEGHELTPDNRVARTGQCLTCVKQRQKHINDESVDIARRRGYEWTGPELEIASRAELTSRQVAAMIGRTVYGVETVRRRLRVEPKLRKMASI